VLRIIAALLAFSAAAFGQIPTATAVVDGTNYLPRRCRCMLATVNGSNFGSTGANISVTVGGKPGFVHQATVTPTQFVVEVPFEVTTGAMATAFANHLGTTTDQLSGLFLSTSSEGVQVTFNSAAAPLFDLMAYTSQEQIVFQEVVQIK
jgi:hypothetical protein